jgi:hypothetical protein
MGHRIAAQGRNSNAIDTRTNASPLSSNLFIGQGLSQGRRLLGGMAGARERLATNARRMRETPGADARTLRADRRPTHQNKTTSTILHFHRLQGIDGQR